MVTKKQLNNLIKDLYDEILNIDIDFDSNNLIGLSEAKGRGEMKIEILNIFRRRFASS